jgi:methionyl-tRNA formyltransferase
MFDTLILLTGPAERSMLPGVLLGHNPGLAILPVEHADELAAIDAQVLRRARLVAFVTSVIVPPAILAQLGYGAFNFHPGPPSYPGWAPAHFALYEYAAEFGATMHVMVEKVDAGPIVAVETFPVPPDISVPGLEGMAYARLAFLFWRMARQLARDCEPPLELPIKWGKRKFYRSTFRAMCEIPPDIARAERDRRMRIFGGDQFGMALTVDLHGTESRVASASR